MIKLIGEKNYDRLMRTVVEPGLQAMREEIDMPLSGGGTLHAEVYNRYDARRAVVMLHGYTESAEKLREMAWYFIANGYSVFSYDHRGHGHSVRVLEDTSVTHVERFEDYLSDLEEFMERIVRPRMGSAPLYLYAHSMGGAVGALALMRHPDWFVRAVLTSPMIAASTKPFPPAAAKAIVSLACRMGKGKQRAFVGKPYSAEGETFERACSTGPARFAYYKEKRARNPHLQNCAPTYNWLREALVVSDALLDPAQLALIRTPLLLCQAKQDDVVLLPEQEKFVSLVRGARLRVFDAKHELYISHDEVLAEYVKAVLDYLAQPVEQEVCPQEEAPAAEAAEEAADAPAQEPAQEEE
ncbi:MAG: alpha/beta fold hydrolase [Clostridia bacterium]|nr:alpha/beta fold hydrolase [Clostridia bacterium]